MDGELANVSLIEHVSETGFRASLIATYNCYFPFYEEVVLRRMMAAGCSHNVLMVDASRCADAFASEDLRPRRAGRDYTLIPVAVGGAFHPKIMLRVGKAKGALFVGSHNMTLAGFGLNDEVTNTFRVEGASLRSGAGPLRQAFEYLAAFVPGALPGVVEAYEGLKLGVPWLDGPMAVGERDRIVLMSSPTGADSLVPDPALRAEERRDRIHLRPILRSEARIPSSFRHGRAPARARGGHRHCDCGDRPG